MSNLEQSSEQAPRSAGRTIFRNTVFGFGAQFGLRIISFLFQILVVRRLGDAQFGQYSIVLAWAGLFGVLGDMGISQYLTREIARDRKAASDYFWDVVTLRAILAVFTSIITTVGAILYGQPSEIVLAVFLYTLTYLLQAFLAPLMSIVTGNERVDLASLFEIVGQVIFMGAGALFLFAGLDFVWLVIAGMLNIPVLIGMAYWVVKRNNYGPPQFRVNRKMWWHLLRAGMPFAFIQLSLSFAFRADTIVLSSYRSDEEIGWYNIAYKLVFTLLSLVYPFSAAIMPTLAREHASNPDSIHPWYYSTVRVMLAIGLPVAVGGMLLAQNIILLLYGAENLPAYIGLMIIIWDLPFLMYTSFCGNMTTSIKREGGAARIYGTLGVINIAMNLILGPRFGLIGAAFATVLTDLTGAMLFYVLFRREFGSGLMFKRLIRMVLSTVVMGVVVYFVRDVNMFAAAAIGAVVYFAMIWLTRAFTPEEQERVMRLIQRITSRLKLRTA